MLMGLRAWQPDLNQFPVSVTFIIKKVLALYHRIEYGTYNEQNRQLPRMARCEIRG